MFDRMACFNVTPRSNRTSRKGGKRPDQALNKNTQSGRGQAIQTRTKTNKALSAPPQVPGLYLLTVLIGNERLTSWDLEPAGARSGPCWFWFVFGSLAPFPTALVLLGLNLIACPLPNRACFGGA